MFDNHILKVEYIILRQLMGENVLPVFDVFYF